MLIATAATCTSCRRIFLFVFPKKTASAIPTRSMKTSSERLQNPVHQRSESFPGTTNVPNNVLLYSYSKKRFFKYMTIFGAVQMVFWFQMSYMSSETLRRQKKLLEECATQGKAVPSFLPEPDSKDTRWYVKYIHAFGKLGGTYPASFATVYLLIGSGIALATFFFSLRSVHQLTLLKGGQSLLVTTFGTFGRFRTFQVPLKDVTTDVGRLGSGAYIPLRVKGRMFYFLLDRTGKFHNAELFDLTAGLQRRWRT